MSWESQAACIGVDPEIFYEKDPRQAKQICAGCPVSLQCLEHAMRFEGFVSDRHGVWGGLTCDERHTLDTGIVPMKKEPNRALRPTCKYKHPMRGPEDYFISRSNGARRCRRCKRDRNKQAYEEKKLRSA